jgi:malonyl-CoA/methylmalonyl-CoA synthetase
VACVVGQVDPESVRDALRERLAAFKIPKKVLVLPDLPRNAMGKVQKAELRRVHVGLFAGT